MGEALQIKRKFTLGREERIKKNSLIKKIICRGERYRTELVDCFYVEGDSNKIAVIVPKKKIKLSTERNLLKRKIREAYRLNKFILNKKNYYLVFFYRSQEKKSFKEIEICLIDALLNLEIKI